MQDSQEIKLALLGERTISNTARDIVKERERVAIVGGASMRDMPLRASIGIIGSDNKPHPEFYDEIDILGAEDKISFAATKGINARSIVDMLERGCTSIEMVNHNTLPYYSRRDRVLELYIKSTPILRESFITYIKRVSSVCGNRKMQFHLHNPSMMAKTISKHPVYFNRIWVTKQYKLKDSQFNALGKTRDFDYWVIRMHTTA